MIQYIFIALAFIGGLAVGGAVLSMIGYFISWALQFIEQMRYDRIRNSFLSDLLSIERYEGHREVKVEQLTQYLIRQWGNGFRAGGSDFRSKINEG